MFLLTKTETFVVDKSKFLLTITHQKNNTPLSQNMYTAVSSLKCVTHAHNISTQRRLVLTSNLLVFTLNDITVNEKNS